MAINILLYLFDIYNICYATYAPQHNVDEYNFQSLLFTISEIRKKKTEKLMIQS